MKLSRNFINDYTNVKDVNINELAEDLVRIGNEYVDVSSIIKVSDSSKLVVGKILDFKKVEGSDKLNYCTVDVGSEVLNIICGAPNVKVDMYVIVALSGIILPGGEIKKVKIMNHESNGMLCSMAELGLDNKFLKEEDTKGIHELVGDFELGSSAIAALELDDTVIDLELTPDRADLLSMLGLAYEVSSITGKEVVLPDADYKSHDSDFASSFKLKAETDNLYALLAKRVNNIVIKESPLFIKNRLMACNIRSINNVVDISNYVMLETGQPLHFYDANSLGDTIGVRMALDNEELTTLDNKKRVLCTDDIVITNGSDAVGLAGVMGGYNTEVESDTTSILIEAAIFNPLNIRGTSKKYLRSEASIRFEKKLDINRCYLALERACYLLEKYASGEVCEGMVEYNTLSREDKIIDVPLSKISSLLGREFNYEEVSVVFNKLNLDFKFSNNIFSVIVPTRKVDLDIVEDVIEEVSRIYGVDNIEGTLPILKSLPAVYDTRKRDIKNKLVNLGLSEVITYSLISEDSLEKFVTDKYEAIKLMSPMSEQKAYLRNSLVNSLIEVYNYNKARNNKDAAIFEIAKCFSKNNNEYIEAYALSGLMSGEFNVGLDHQKIDFYVLKGIIEEVLDYIGYKDIYKFELIKLPQDMHPTLSLNIIVNGVNIGFMGAVHPNILKDEVFVFEINLSKLFEIKRNNNSYKEHGKFPGITKDFAFILNKEVVSSDVIDTIKSSSKELLQSVSLFDIYEGDKIDNNKKSYSYTLYFESPLRTLTDEEVDKEFNKIIDIVVKEYDAVLRDK